MESRRVGGKADAPPAHTSGPSSPWRDRLKLAPKTLLILAIGLDAITLGIDALLPAEYPMAALYVGPTLVSFFLPWRRALIGLAVLGSACVIIGYVASPASPAFGSPETLMGRVLAIGVIWCATALALAHQSSRAAITEGQTTLRGSEARFRSILETAPEALITIDQRGIIESFSRSAEALFGYTADEVIGRNVKILMPSPHQEQHDEYVARYLRTGERRIIGIGRVVSGLKKDGSIFPMELAVGEAIVNSHRIFTGFIRDLTARQKIEQELRQAQKMEAVGQLTGGIAHDFNNLLTVITGNLEMLEGKITDRAQRELLSEAQEAAGLGAQLTQRLLAFGRRQPLSPKRVDIGQLVRDFGELLRRTLGETIELETNIKSGPHHAVIDPSQLQNAILNLALNARDAMPSGGKLLIEVAESALDADYAKVHPEVRIGRYVCLAITDTGGGMTKEVQERAFEPFFSTKPTGSGTGLGLSMVYGFVKQSGGHVLMYSEPGHGTTVRLHLPYAHPEIAGPTQAALDVATAFPAHGETVLVVEDDARVRRVTTSRLRQLGYHVIEADSGPSALEVVTRADRVDLLFTDIVMPGGMNGFELAEAVRTSRPGVRVLFTSGYAEPELLARRETGSSDWLRKPYAAVDLARKLREVLG
jgi:PAS domain S-box-containing protein